MSLALAASLLAAAPALGQVSPADTLPPATEQVVRTLRSRRAADAPSDDELLAALAPPLESGVAPLLDVLRTRRLPALDEGEELQVLNVYQQALALDAIAALEPEAVRAQVHAWVGDEPGVRERSVAVRALGAGGSDRDLPQLLAWTRPVEEDAPVDDALADALREGLARLCGRDPFTIERLQRDWNAFLPDQVEAAVHALGDLRDPAGLYWYADVLALSPEHGPLVLAKIVLLAPSPWPSLDGDLANLVRPWLDPEDPMRCQAAARALGALDDVDSVPALIELLGAGGPVAESAHWALRGITDRRFPNDAALWEDWLRGEERFERERLPALLGKLTSRRYEELGHALRELPHHPLLRHALVPELEPLLGHRAAWVRRRTCQVLADLRSPLAVPALAGRLADPDPEVVAAAHAGLLRITGEDLPPEPYDWRELVADTRWGR